MITSAVAIQGKREEKTFQVVEPITRVVDQGTHATVRARFSAVPLLQGVTSAADQQSLYIVSLYSPLKMLVFNYDNTLLLSNLCSRCVRMIKYII